MTDQLTPSGKKIWAVVGTLLLIVGIAGCGTEQMWKKPYSTPEESGGENPFLRIKSPEEGSALQQEEKKAESQEKIGLTETKTVPGAKHMATQPPLRQPVWGKKTAKEKNEAAKAVHVELAFDNADLYEVLDVTLYDLFGLSYMVDPTLKATVTFHIKGDFTQDQFINAFNQALQLNNLSIVRGSGNIYKIMPRTNSAGSANAPLTVTDESGLVGDVTRMIRLRYVSVATAAASIAPFLSKGASVVQDAVNNALLITDTAENITRAVAILGAIDIEYFSDLSWQIFPVKEVDVSTIASDLDNILKAGGLYKRQGAAEGSFEIFPIKSMNAILVVTRWPNILTLVQDWLSAMDHMTDSDTNVFVYFAENASAVDLADVLQQVFLGRASSSRSSRAGTTGKTGTYRSRMSSSGLSAGGLGGSSSLGGGLGGSSLGSSSLGSSSLGGSYGSSSGYNTSSSRLRSNTPYPSQTIVRSTAAGGGKSADELASNVEIIPDEVNNAILFKASNRDYKRILTVLKKLDIQPRQVLINVLVAEITLSGSTSYGIEWFLNKNIGSLGGSSGDYTAQGALDNGTTRPINTPLGSVSTQNGFFFTVYDPTNFMRGLVSLLGSDSDVNILSSPNILALDNTPAVIEVGTDVPTITGSTTSATAGTTITNTVQYRKTGILLTVTPHINSSGLVKMELDQEVSDLGDFNAALNNYSFLTRRADTSVVVEDNQTIIMAGLMKSNKTNSQSGIPYLKDIPLLGYLFGGVSKSNNKTELIFMITPHVIQNRNDADQITKEFAQKVKELKAGGKEKQ